MNGTKARSSGFHVPGRKVCGVCGRVLDRNESLGVWMHPGDPSLRDHLVVPVDDTEVAVVEKCDFCFATGTEWVLPAADFVVGPNHASSGDWAACGDCAKIIEADDWEALAQRVKDQWPAELGEPISANGEMWLRRTYRALRENVAGPLLRIER